LAHVYMYLLKSYSSEKNLSTFLLHLLSFQSSLQSGQNKYKSYYCFSSHACTAFTVQSI